MLKKIAKKERTFRIALRECDVKWIDEGNCSTYRVIIVPRK